MKLEVLDILIIAGWVGITAGLAMVRPEAGLIGGGAILMALGIYLATPASGKKKRD